MKRLPLERACPLVVTESDELSRDLLFTESPLVVSAVSISLWTLRIEDLDVLCSLSLTVGFRGERRSWSDEECRRLFFDFIDSAELSRDFSKAASLAFSTDVLSLFLRPLRLGVEGVSILLSFPDLVTVSFGDFETCSVKDKFFCAGDLVNMLLRGDGVLTTGDDSPISSCDELFISANVSRA